MPLLRIERLGEDATLGLWTLTEEERFFFDNYPCLHSFQKEIDTIGSKQRRMEKLATRALVVEMTKNTELTIEHDGNGKPLVKGYYVSISHTKGLVALMLSTTREVAVDVEYDSDRVSRIAHKFVNTNETMPTNAHLLLAWCAKEAIFKYFSSDNLLSSDIYLQPFKVEDNGIIVGRNLKRNLLVSARYSRFNGFTMVYI